MEEFLRIPLDWVYSNFWYALIAGSILPRIGYSAWWTLLFFVPYVNLIAGIVFTSLTWPIETELGKSKKDALVNAVLARRWLRRGEPPVDARATHES